MNEQSNKTQDYLVSSLTDIQARLVECAKLEQRLTHAQHVKPDYRELINRVDTLIDAARALNKRIQTVGR
jgi:hypothetical protein